MLRQWIWTVAGLAALAGCASGAITPGKSFRDTTQPLSVTTRGNGIQDMSGPWFVRGHFPGDGSIAMVTFLPQFEGGQAVEFIQEGCDLSGDCESAAEVWRAQPLGQNRWQLTSKTARSAIELWVIWVDDGFRTAAIGTPDGSYGWILDRRPAGGADRVRAAGEILAFNGYDTSRMKVK
ncbi:MAG: lipocalin family protein [Pseudomonadota bacterium]